MAISYHRSELPLLSVLGGIAAVELIGVHLLVSLWSPTAAWLLTIASVVFIAQLVMLTASMKRHPLLIEEAGLRIRRGALEEMAVPWSAIAEVRATGFAEVPKGAGVWRASFLAHPNVEVRLAQPLVRRRLGRERLVRTILLRADEPEAMVRSVERERKAGAM